MVRWCMPVRGLLVAVGLSVLGGMDAGARGSPGGFRVGEAFPLLKFPRLDGSGLGTLADFRGQKVLLIQFASW